MKKLLILLLFFIFIIISLFGQTLRIAYIDIDRIVSESNDSHEAERLFQIDRDDWVRQIDEMEAEILRQERELEIRRLTLTESGRREAENRISVLIRERQQLIERIFSENGLAATRRNELMLPIMEKLRLALDKIAVEENYSMIFDASAGVVWAQERLDITSQIVEEMNRQ